MKQSNSLDQLLLWLVLILVGLGFFILVSASLGLFATGQVNFMSMAVRQFFLGILGGLVTMLVISHIPYTWWRQYALPIFLLSLAVTSLTFVSAISYTHGGAARWIDLGFLTFQPVEILKVGFVVYCAGWAAHVQDKIHDWRYSLLPFSIMLGLVGLILVFQPDFGSFLVITLAAAAIFVAAGARWLHILYAFLTAIAGIGALAVSKPYIQERITTFLNPASSPLGSSYQIQQSLIAVGSGEWFGRGFGQSIQKFSFLPEPISDSIFAVFAEEWGFVGAVILILLFVAFILRGYTIAAESPDAFSRLLVVGLISLIAAQVFINIGAMLGMLPLTGLPLTFISHGGTALVTALASVGIILNISRHT